MDRFELIDATHAEGAQFFVSDTASMRSHAAQPHFERASHAVMTLNALRPTWFASTHKGVVYVDVRAMVDGNLYADARCFTRMDGVSDLGLLSAVKSLEAHLHKYVALHG